MSNSSRGVRLNLMVVLLGVALPFAVSKLSQSFGWARLSIVLSFLLTSLNFFHGKVVTAEDRELNMALRDSPRYALGEFSLSILLVLIFVFIAVEISNPFAVVTLNLALRVVDCVLIQMLSRFLPREGLVARAEHVWLLINFGAIAFWVGALVAIVSVPNGWRDYALVIVGAVYSVVSVGDILIDYVVNRKLYFEECVMWSDLARLWDATQGWGGDLYREAVIWPALESVIGSPNEAMRILDLGCGNGCLSRRFSANGCEVVAVDGFDEMLELAATYESTNITYLRVDLNENCGQIHGGVFDVVVSCFTTQDLENLKCVLRTAAENVAPQGSVIIIYEDLDRFGPSSHQSTRRVWKDKPGTPGRRQLVTWDPALLSHSGNGIALRSRGFLDAGVEQSTVNRVWTEAEYRDALAAVGMEVTESMTLVPNKKAGVADQTGLIRDYSLNPRFALLSAQLVRRFTEDATTAELTIRPETGSATDSPS